MVMLEYGSFTYAEFDVSALNPSALENQSILLFSMWIDNSHNISTSRAIPTLRKHAFHDHPPNSPSEIFSYPKNIQISLKTIFNDISFDRFMSGWFDFEIF